MKGFALKITKATSAMMIAAATSYAAWVILAVVSDTSALSTGTGVTGGEFANLGVFPVGTFAVGKAVEHVAKIFA